MFEDGLASGLDLRASAALVALLAIWLTVRVANRGRAARLDAATRNTGWDQDLQYEAWLDRVLEALRRKSEGFSSTVSFATVQGEQEMRFAVRAVNEGVLAWDGDRLRIADDRSER